MKLSNLMGTAKKKKRIGRGGSRGGTSGRGHKGQKARSGGSPRVGFEGGQMPLYRRLPKRGFTNARFKKEYQVVSLDRINALFDEGAQITKEFLIEKGLVSSKKTIPGKNLLVKILAGKESIKKIIISADAFSKSAIKMIEDSGGEARLTKES